FFCQLLVLQHLQPEGVIALVILRVERFEIGGKSLIEPDVRPILSLHQVAEPVLSQLVRDQRLARVVRIGARIVQGGIRERRGAHVLHAAEEIALDGNLRVLLVRVWNPQRVREKADHVGCEMEWPPGGSRAHRIQYVMIDGQPSMAVTHLSPGSDGQGSQVRAVRDAFHPIIRGLTAALAHAGQPPVGDDTLALGNGYDQLTGGHVIRVVPAGKPEVIEFRLSLRPDLPGSLRIRGARVQEIKAGARKSMEPDLHPQRFSTPVGMIQSDPQSRGIGSEGQRQSTMPPAVQSHVLDRQFGAVQVEPPETGAERLECDFLVSEYLARRRRKMKRELVAGDVIGALWRVLGQGGVAEYVPRRRFGT